MNPACSLWSLNISRCLPTLIGDAVGALPWWLPLVGWGLIAIAVLYGLNALKGVAGWPGVAAAVVAIVAIVENVRGRQGKGVLPFKIEPSDTPDIHPVDAQPAPSRTVVPARRRSRTIWDNFRSKP
jgi:hypothetical protein